MRSQKYALVFLTTSLAIGLTSHKAIAFSLSGDISSKTIAYKDAAGRPSTITVKRVINMTSKEVTSNAVEIDGIRLEILVPDRVWRIPENQPNATTPVRIGFQIKNNTPYPIRFPPLDPLMVFPLEIMDANGKLLQRQGGRDILLKSPQLACPLVQPQESVTFFLKAQLFWQNNQLLFGGADGLGGGWSFDNLNPGNYQIRLRYISSRAVLFCDEPHMDEYKLTRGIWTGQMLTPLVNIRLVKS
ncbi:MAG: hypothetical protein ACM65L_11360 [Microcoleus sp.]